MIKPTVRETSPLSETCPYCRTHFTRSWFEVSHGKPGVLHTFDLRWTNCSKCDRFIVSLEEMSGVALKSPRPDGRTWEMKTVNSLILWPKPEEPDVDPLTGLHRKKTFELAAPGYIVSAIQKGAPLSLIFLDLDDFKVINTEGHSVGDSVLRAVGPILATAVRGKGTAFRWGGEEFALLLPNYETGEGAAFGERLRKAIETSPLGTPPHTVTVSVGVATVPEHGKTFETLFDAAEKAMKQAKKMGKNRVQVAEPDRATEAGN